MKERRRQVAVGQLQDEVPRVPSEAAAGFEQPRFVRCRVFAPSTLCFNVGGQEYRVGYVPGDSDSGMFGGNSNWLGSIWMPMQLMLIRALVNQYAHLGNHFKVECPVGSGRQLNLLEVSQEIARQLSRLFVRNKEGRRPAHGHHSRWNDGTGGTTFCSTSTSMGTPVQAWGRAIRRAGPASSPT